MDREGLVDILRRRKETLQPGDVGLSHGRRRGTAGLRREEKSLCCPTCRPTSTHASSRAAVTTLRANGRRYRTPSATNSGRARPPVRPRRARRTPSRDPHRTRQPGADTRTRPARHPAQVVSDLGVTFKQNRSPKLCWESRRSTPGFGAAPSTARSPTSPSAIGSTVRSRAALTQLHRQSACGRWPLRRRPRGARTHRPPPARARFSPPRT